MFWWRKKKLDFEDWIPTIETIARDFGVSAKKHRYVGDDLVMSLYIGSRCVGQINLHHIARLWLKGDIAIPYVIHEFTQAIKR